MFCSKIHESVHKAISAAVSTRRRWGGERKKKKDRSGEKVRWSRGGE